MACSLMGNHMAREMKDGFQQQRIINEIYNRPLPENETGLINNEELKELLQKEITFDNRNTVIHYRL